jgi:hypothetical protein
MKSAVSGVAAATIGAPAIAQRASTRTLRFTRQMSTGAPSVSGWTVSLIITSWNQGLTRTRG